VLARKKTQNYGGKGRRSLIPFTQKANWKENRTNLKQNRGRRKIWGGVFGVGRKSKGLIFLGKGGLIEQNSFPQAGESPFSRRRKQHTELKAKKAGGPTFLLGSIGNPSVLDNGKKRVGKSQKKNTLNHTEPWVALRLSRTVRGISFRESPRVFTGRPQIKRKGAEKLGHHRAGGVLICCRFRKQKQGSKPKERENDDV